MTSLLNLTPGIIRKQSGVVHQIIDPSGWVKLLTMQDPMMVVKASQWIRVRNGVYKGDLNFLKYVESWGGQVLVIPCYVEFVLEHSPSVSVRLRLFPSVLRPSITFFPTIHSFSVPFRPIRVRVMFPSFPSHPFQPSTLGSDPFPVSSDLALYYFRYCSAITPISPTPSLPVSLLSSVPYCL